MSHDTNALSVTGTSVSGEGESDEQEECIHLIFPPSSCTLCNPPKPDPFTTFKREPGEPTSYGAMEGAITVKAQYDGTCGQCQGRIEKDLDEVVLYRGQWCHRDCGE